MVYFRPYTKIPGLYLKRGHDRFLPHLWQFLFTFMQPHNATDFWNDESLQTVNKTCFSGFPNILTSHLNRIRPLNYATETGTRNAKGRGDVTQLRHADPTQCCQLFCHNEQVCAWNLVHKVHHRISRADSIQPVPSHPSFTTHFSINLAAPQILSPSCRSCLYKEIIRVYCENHAQTLKETACAKCKVP